MYGVRACVADHYRKEYGKELSKRQQVGDADGRGSGAGGAIFVRRTGCSTHRSASSERMLRPKRYDLCKFI